MGRVIHDDLIGRHTSLFIYLLIYDPVDSVLRASCPTSLASINDSCASAPGKTAFGSAPLPPLAVQPLPLSQLVLIVGSVLKKR